MKKDILKGLLVITALSLSACSSSENLVTPDLNSNATISSNIQKPVKNDVSDKVMNSSFALQVAKAFDVNKDGKVDSLEAPITIANLKAPTSSYKSIQNYDNGLTGGKPTTAIPVQQIADMLSTDGGMVDLIGTKLSEPNRNKMLAELSSVLVKDSIASGGKVYGYSSTVGYFTAKTTIKVCNMDASLIAKKIADQLYISSSDKVNGEPAQMANGSFSINAGYATIDETYKTRLQFSQYDIFGSKNYPFFGTHTISDASGKVVK